MLYDEGQYTRKDGDEEDDRHLSLLPKTGKNHQGPDTITVLPDDDSVQWTWDTHWRLVLTAAGLENV